MLVETALSLVTMVCHLKKVFHRTRPHFEARLAYVVRLLFNALLGSEPSRFNRRPIPQDRLSASSLSTLYELMDAEVSIGADCMSAPASRWIRDDRYRRRKSRRWERYGSDPDFIVPSLGGLTRGKPLTGPLKSIVGLIVP